MFEHKQSPLLPGRAFLARVGKCSLLSAGLFAVTILTGGSIFHQMEQLPWADCILNAVTIMTGVGISVVLKSPETKLLISGYALFSTIMFFIVLAILFSPLVHRFMHKFHLEIDKK